MTDYIKREDAKELFEMLLESYKDAGTQNISTMVHFAPREFHLSEDDEIADFNFELDGWRNDFMKIESADVAPVRHGRWVEDKNRTEEIYTHPVKCSACGQTEVLEFGILTAYCPNCGAKMDKERDCDTCKHDWRAWEHPICDECSKGSSNWERKDEEEE